MGDYKIISITMDNSGTSGVAIETKNVYELKDFKEDAPSQEISFYRMNQDGSFDNGTTLEEMLRVSIERLTDLNSRFSCRENSIAITKIQEALMWLNKRTEDRKARGVEGMHKV